MFKQLKVIIVIFYSLNLLAIPSYSSSKYDPKRTKLIDTFSGSVYTNFLFRGNMPTNSTGFAYDELVASFKSIISNNNLTFPDKFMVWDISYLSTEIEFPDLEIEIKFFRANPHLGIFIHWPIVGSLFKPSDSISRLSVRDYVEHSIDRLDIKIPNFYGNLHSDDRSSSKIIYTHCEAGTDRTGEVSGSYYMQYLNMSFAEALHIDDQIHHRPIYNASRNAMQFYCYYLKLIQGYINLNCKLPTTIIKSLNLN